MAALIKINALAGTPLISGFSVRISEQTAHALAGDTPLPLPGHNYAIVWGAENQQVKTRLCLLNNGGDYHLVCHTDPLERWPALFSIEIEEE